MKQLLALGSKAYQQARRVTRKQGGFTLIELLVVVAVMGVLAAVAVPNLARFAGRGATEAKAAELASVQTAMDAYMAEHALETVTAATATTTYTAFANIIPNATHGSLAAYIRQASASNGVSYCWDLNGLVTQEDPAAAC